MHGGFLDAVANDPLIFLNQAKQLGFNPTMMTYNDALDAFATETNNSLLDNVVILNWEITSPVFTDMYQKAYGIPPTKSADKWFDAVYVVATALANVSDPSQASAYIASHSFTTPNSTVTFTPDHAVQKTNTQVEIVKNGIPVPLH